MSVGVESSFHEIDAEVISGIDFDEARRLNIDSDTYEFYEVEASGRRLFIKRLKKEFASKPFYRSALKKEYEIGRALRHASLPSYKGFYGDYLALDYIEGKSVSKMTRDGDRWLKDEQNVDRLLTQLIETVEYLHRHNVVHCDIRDANLMVTATVGNLVLIDFDKSFTDWMDKTSGSPAVYGVDETRVGNPQIDFNGIGMLVDGLIKHLPRARQRRYKRIKDLCLAENSDSRAVIAALNSGGGNRAWWYYTAGIMAFSAVAFGLFFLKSPTGKNHEDDYPTTEIVGNYKESPQVQPDSKIVEKEGSATGNMPLKAESIGLTENKAPTDDKTVAEKAQYEDLIENELSAVTPMLVNAELITESAIQVKQEKLENIIEEIEKGFTAASQTIRKELKEKNPELTGQRITDILETSERYRTVSRAKETLVRQLRDIVSQNAGNP